MLFGPAPTTTTSKFSNSVAFLSAHALFREDALEDLKKVLKAWKALKPLQASGLLSA
jgi:hypothetical protein